ncbi:hypothetical protein SIN09_24140 [Streptomyces sp. F8]|nr:hypothetical protein [Streptomyces sp. F8]MDX6762421.1 hypothetical protein [Streptomyces sp. F8]
MNSRSSLVLASPPPLSTSSITASVTSRSQVSSISVSSAPLLPK